jgi:hypothetical protein
MQDLNKNTVSEIAQKNDTAESFFAYLGQRKREARGGENSVDSIKRQMRLRGFQPVPQELLTTLRELDRAGIIELKGKQFRWKFGIKDVMRAVEPTQAPAPVIPLKTPLSQKTLVVCLDRERQFTAQFPSKLSQEELKLIYNTLEQNSQG